MTVQCENCGKVNQYHCEWACSVALAQKAGGKTIAPNGLPITCIKADGTMMEHEHANHVHYMFPVEVEITDPVLNEQYKEGIEGYPKGYIFKEDHAAIYTDGSVLVTLYECTYSLWSLHYGGECLGGFHERKKWRLTEESLKAVRERCTLNGTKEC